MPLILAHLTSGTCQRDFHLNFGIVKSIWEIYTLGPPTIGCGRVTVAGKTSEQEGSLGLMLVYDVACRDSDSAPSTPRSMSTSAASSPLRAAPFEAAPRLRISDDGARRQHWGHSASDPGHRARAFPPSSPE